MTLESVLQKEKKVKDNPKGVCVCVFPSDLAILIIMLTALMSLCRCVSCVFFLPLFPLLSVLILLLLAMWNSILAAIGPLFYHLVIPTVTTYYHSIRRGKICSQIRVSFVQLLSNNLHLLQMCCIEEII